MYASSLPEATKMFLYGWIGLAALCALFTMLLFGQIGPYLAVLACGGMGAGAYLRFKALKTP